MSSLMDLRFVTVVGKGGVGKTTVAAALALAAAREGKRVLVAMCNAKERLSQMLEVDPIGPENRQILPGIDAVNMTPKLALEEYGMMVLKVRTVYKAIFENRFVSAFLRGTPGLEAWAMLGKAYFHSKETRQDGSPRYDMVILDSPATGHGLDMLRVPKVLLEVAPPGLLRREAEGAWQLFSDPTRAGALMVTLPEDMPANETIELHAALTQELNLPVAGLAVNSMLPSLFDDAERTWLRGLSPEQLQDPQVAGLLNAGRRRTEREIVQRDAMAFLSRSLDMPRYELPALLVPEFNRQAIDQLAGCFQ